MKLEILQAADGSWYWHMIVSGRITASGHGYNRKYHAKRAWARRVKRIKAL